jgi:hypothetical protein
MAKRRCRGRLARNCALDMDSPDEEANALMSSFTPDRTVSFSCQEAIS